MHARAVGFRVGAQHLGVAVEHRDQVAAVPGDERVHVDGWRRHGLGDRREQTVGPLAGHGRERHRARIPGRQARASRARHQIDLVEHQHLGHVGRADLLQHGVDGLDLVLQRRRGRVGDVDDHVRQASPPPASNGTPPRGRAAASRRTPPCRTAWPPARPAGRSGGSSGRAWRTAGRPRSRRRRSAGAAARTSRRSCSRRSPPAACSSAGGWRAACRASSASP